MTEPGFLERSSALFGKRFSEGIVKLRLTKREIMQ